MGIQDRDYMRRRDRGDDDEGPSEGGSLRMPDALAGRIGHGAMIGAIVLAVVVIVALALSN